MSGLAISIQISSTGAATAFAALRQVNDDLRPVLDDIGAELESSTLERFETNVGPDGVAWPQSLRAQTSGGRTLVESGTLRDSVSYRVDGNHAVEVGAGGAAGAYAAIHQLGGTITAKGQALRFQLATGQWVTRKSVRIPARPYLGLSADDQVAVPEIVVDHWRRALYAGLG
jgi:phage virion morphogenesis protein